MEQENRTSELLNVNIDEIVSNSINKAIQKKRKIKIICAAITGVLLAGIIAIVICLTAVPNSIYSKAKSLMTDGLYNEALNQYDTYIRYKNSLLDIAHIDEETLCKVSTIPTDDELSEYINEVKYQRAVSYLQNKEYDVAIIEFDTLGDYKDSESKFQECWYQSATSHLENKEYDAAIKEFDTLGDYKDSKDKSQECWYQKGLLVITSEEYYQAIDIFEKLNGYKDSNEKINLCKDKLYNIAISLMNDGEHERAINELKKLGHYKDSDDLLVESATTIASNYEKNGDIENAISWYESVGNREKANSIRYNYVQSNMDRKDITTYDYLVKLKADNYQDSANIYSSLYKFSIKLSFDNYKLCYVVTGGPPKGDVTIRISNVGYWHNGSRSEEIVAEDYTFTSPAEYEGIEQRRDVILLYAYRHTITAFDGISGKELAQIVDPYK